MWWKRKRVKHKLSQPRRFWCVQCAIIFHDLDRQCPSPHRLASIDSSHQPSPAVPCGDGTHFAFKSRTTLQCLTAWLQVYEQHSPWNDFQGLHGDRKLVARCQFLLLPGRAARYGKLLFPDCQLPPSRVLLPPSFRPRCTWTKRQLRRRFELMPRFPWRLKVL